MSNEVLKPYEDLHLQYIAGTWREGSAGDVYVDTNPYNGEELARHKLATKADVDEAYAAALAAQPAWAAALPQEREAVLLKAAEIMTARFDELLQWSIRESGSTVVKASFEVGATIDIIKEAASFPYRMHGELRPSTVPGKEHRIYRKALGVVTVISPWNFAYNLSGRSIATALAVGNAVVLKPASDTPLTGGLLLAKVFEEAGLPAGLFSVLIGKGSEIGDYLVDHDAPSLVSFTGSTEVGKRLGARCMSAPMLKRVALELGGNSPLVVLDDADVDYAVSLGLMGRYLHQGQICMSTNRIIVDEGIYDEFVEKYVARAAKIKYGDPADPEVLVGPIINESQMKKVMGVIEQAKADGATLELGGTAEGNVIVPTVFSNVDPNSSLALNETFGPVVPLIKAKDEADALRLANMSDYGLSSAVCTTDLDRGFKFAMQLKAGMTHINDMTVQDERHVPFGGEKNSGLGRFNGDWILEEMTRTHWISFQHENRPFPV